MLVIENNSVYEIDEDCIRTKKVPKECETAAKLQKEHRSDRTNKNNGQT